MDKLNPCPFCGGEGHTSKSIGQCLHRPSRNGWHVYCGDCQTLFGYDDDYAGIYETEKQAVEAWNRRITPAISAVYGANNPREGY